MMQTDEQQRDKYKEAELKYKRLDVITRGVGAFAAIASAIAAFLAIRGYTGFPNSVPQVAPTPVTSPQVPNASVNSAPVRSQVPVTTSKPNPTTQRSNSAVKSNQPVDDDQDDKGDDR
jgi:hypothetical protein